VLIVAHLGPVEAVREIQLHELQQNATALVQLF